MVVPVLSEGMLLSWFSVLPVPLGWPVSVDVYKRQGDSIKPFLPYCRDGGKSLFILVKTSNRSSVEVQDLLSGGRLVHTAMADLVNRWGGELWGKYGYSQVAAVVGAPYPEILRSLRAKYDRMFFLVPGYGAQGGTAKSVQHAFDRFGHGAVVCAARSILGACCLLYTSRCV